MGNSISLWEKRCSRCKEVKLRDDFYVSNDKPDGLGTWCKTCRATYSKAHPYVPNKVFVVDIPDGTRLCMRCKEEKAYTEFTKDARHHDGFSRYCKTCIKVHYAMKPETSRKTKILNKYKMTIAQYDELAEMQGFVCAICKKPEIGIDPRSNASRRLAVDHCHKTGRIRELLCYKCNCAFGLMDENPLSIVALLAYAEKWQAKEEGY